MSSHNIYPADIDKLEELYTLLDEAESADQNNLDNAIAAKHFKTQIDQIEYRICQVLRQVLNQPIMCD
jgi:hypothetical protein